MISGEKREIKEYFAFISYNKRDFKWGKWLFDKFERFSMPATMCKEQGFAKKPASPVFFAPYEIQPGDLPNELKDRLRASKKLVVICSPNSAKSDWVGKEIRYFYELGREKDIYFFIVGGVPNTEDDNDCYNPVIKELGLSECLGADATEKVEQFNWLNKELAFAKLVSKLLGVEVNDVWQRRRRRLITLLVCWIVGVFSMIGAISYTWKMNQPIDVAVNWNELTPKNESLPLPNNAGVFLFLENDTIYEKFISVENTLIFANIPHHFVGEKVKLLFEDTENLYKGVDTTILICENVVIDIERNPLKYGVVKFRLISRTTFEGVGNCSVEVGGVTGVTNSNGIVELQIPIAQQRTKYKINSDVSLEWDSIIGLSSDDVVVFVLDK